MTYGIVFSGSPCIYNDVCYCRLYMDMANHQHIPSYLLRGLNPMLYEDNIYYDTPWNFITWDLKLTWEPYKDFLEGIVSSWVYWISYMWIIFHYSIYGIIPFFVTTHIVCFNAVGRFQWDVFTTTMEFIAVTFIKMYYVFVINKLLRK